MKGQRILTVVLVTLMAMTVVGAAGILTVTNAAPTPDQTSATQQIKSPPQHTFAYTPTVWYTPGKTAVFLPWQYNVHSALYGIEGGPAEHREWARWAMAYASIKGASYAWSWSGVGVRWQLKGISADQLEGKTCTITIKESYMLAAWGEGTNSYLWTLTGVSDNDLYSYRGYALDANVTSNNFIRETTTVSYTFPLLNVTYYDAVNDNIYGSVVSSPQGRLDTNGSASAMSVVYAITVTFS